MSYLLLLASAFIILLYANIRIILALFSDERRWDILLPAWGGALVWAGFAVHAVERELFGPFPLGYQADLDMILVMGGAALMVFPKVLGWLAPLIDRLRPKGATRERLSQKN